MPVAGMVESEIGAAGGSMRVADVGRIVDRCSWTFVVGS